MELWLILWLVFVLSLVLLPLGYGWGYRSWGPPRPPHRRARPETPAEDRTAAEREIDGWGVLALVVWVALTVALVWLLVALVV